LQQNVSVERKLRYGWVQVGDRLEERFTIVNESWLPVLWAQVIDESDLPDYQVGRVASCAGQNTVHWTTDQVCSRRGVFTLGPWSMRMSDPFGFFTLTFAQQESEAIAIYPPVVELPQIALPRGLAAGPSRAHRRSTETTVDVSQTRAYQPNDPWRLIHWPSTAHRSELIVRDFDTEISGDLWIILDLDRSVQAGQDEESTEEYGVILAASLADRTLRQSRAVGLLAHGLDQAVVPTGRGKGHLWRILHVLAAAKAGGEHRLAEVIHGMRDSLGQGTTVLVITPSCEPDWVDALLPLTRFGIAPTVVLLDAESFTAGEQPTPSVGVHSRSSIGVSSTPSVGAGSTPSVGVSRMRELLAEANITVHIIQQGYPFEHVIPPERRGFWEFKVSPLGRAVLVRRPEEA
jgi:uncharacterized protein (DUF58 family)